MIDVPAETKKALKDGCFRKNYKIDIVHFGYHGADVVDVYDWNVIPLTMDTQYYPHGDAWCARYTILEPCEIVLEAPEGVDTFFTIYDKDLDASPITSGRITTGKSDRYVVNGGAIITMGTEMYGLPATIYYDNKLTDIIDDTITNDSIVSESVKIDERLCSNPTLKYGSCEGSSIEFECFNHHVKEGDILRVSVDIYHDDEHFNNIRLGYFTVSQCLKQASTGIQKILAYNRMALDDLNNNIDFSELMVDPISKPKVSVYTLFNHIRKTLRGDDYYFDWDELYGFSRAADTRTADITFDGLTYVQGSKTYTLHGYGRYLAWTLAESPDQYCIHVNLVKFKNLLRTILKEIEHELRIYMEIDEENFEFHSKFAQLCGVTVINKNNVSTTYTLPEFKNVNGGLADDIYLANVKTIRFCIPDQLYGKSGSTIDDLYGWEYDSSRYFSDDGYEFEIDINSTYMENDIFIDLYKKCISANAEITPRQVLSSIYELEGYFGSIDKASNKLIERELKGYELYPSESLYPANNLPPSGISTRLTPVIYSKLWVDTSAEKILRNVIIKYKTLVNNQEKEETYIYTNNSAGNTDYYIADNALIDMFTWTKQEIYDIIPGIPDYYVEKWFPFEAWCPGLPYLEAGDSIDINVDGEMHRGYIFQRQLQGIQNIQDTFISEELNYY